MDINRPSVLETMNDAIRDVLAHVSRVSHERGFAKSTYYFVNGLDQDVTVQPQASYNESFTDIFNVGAPIAIVAGTKVYQTLSDRHPFTRFSVTAGILPTTGSFKITAAQNGI